MCWDEEGHTMSKESLMGRGILRDEVFCKDFGKDLSSDGSAGESLGQRLFSFTSRTLNFMPIRVESLRIIAQLL